MRYPVVVDAAGVVEVPSFDNSYIIFKASETSTTVWMLKSLAWISTSSVPNLSVRLPRILKKNPKYYAHLQNVLFYILNQKPYQKKGLPENDVIFFYLMKIH